MHLRMSNIKSWNFDKKMKLFTSMAIILCAMTILAISTISSAVSLTEKSRNLTMTQLDTLASKLDNMLEDYKETSIAVMMDVNIHKFLTKTDLTGKEATKVTNDASNTLLNIDNLQAYTNFLAVVKQDASGYLYRGGISIASARFLKTYADDYQNSTFTGYGTMRMSFNTAFYNGKIYSLNIYQPIYDPRRIGRELGLLCINVDAEALGVLYNGKDNAENTDIALVDIKGDIISSSEHSDIGKKADYLDKTAGISGSFKQDGNLYVYQRVGDWDYYIVENIPFSALYGDSIRITAILVLLIFLMVILGMYASAKMVSKAYLPMNQLIHKMDSVSEGRLDIRFHAENLGDDFKKTADGFNYMMDRINELMEQIKAEQHQLAQIHFQALQAQISPHFLYNTLDCIHWQAAAEGNREVSTLVKALATYYRLCLSKGQDIIPLSQELEHAKSYLTIQNTRYGDIIESIIAIPSELMQVRIPKMTLQPLIENSIYHGIKIKEGMKGTICIKAYREADKVIITLEDSGRGMTQEQIDEMNASISVFDESFGYGVRNVNKRIELLFGVQYGLHYSKSATDGVRVDIVLPVKGEDNDGGKRNV